MNENCLISKEELLEDTRIVIINSKNKIKEIREKSEKLDREIKKVKHQLSLLL